MTNEKHLSNVDLVKKNGELEKENYEITKNGALKQNLFTGISVSANVFLVWLAFFHFPQESLVWTSNAGAVCQAAPINQPKVHQQLAANLAVEAAISIYSYDHLNWKKTISMVAERYFTSDFRDQFIPIFGDSANLKAVIQNYYIVTATQIDGKPAQISKKGVRKGAYFWEIQVPLRVSYVAGRTSEEEKVLATVTVMQVDPSRINPSGIAVDNIVTQQLIQ